MRRAMLAGHQDRRNLHVVLQIRALDGVAQADLNGRSLHIGTLTHGRLVAGASCIARVATERRQAIRRAHSATHILHYALQKNLGRHAQQQGSKVDDDWLRFDFTNMAAVSAEELEQIEKDTDRDKFMSTEEALEYRLIDKVITNMQQAKAVG